MKNLAILLCEFHAAFLVYPVFVENSKVSMEGVLQRPQVSSEFFARSMRTLAKTPSRNEETESQS